MNDPEIRVGETLVEDGLISCTIQLPEGYVLDEVQMDGDEPVVYAIKDER